MMKLKHFFLASLAAGLFASCSNDILDPNEGKVLENETKTFVKVSLVSTDGATRAKTGEFNDDLFEDGLASENKVTSAILLFYDINKRFVGTTTISANETDDDVSFNGNGDLTISRVLTAVAEVNLPENTNHPAYVVAFVNPTSAYNDLTNYDNLDDLSHIIRQRSELSTTGMTMNNSVSYDEALGLPTYATAVDFASQFYKTREDALKPGCESVNITIERVEAKVKFSFDESFKSNPFPSSEDNDKVEYSLKFVPEGWFVNATEKNTFLLKNFRAGSDNFYKEKDKDNKETIITNASFNGFLSFATLQSRFSNTVDHRELEFNEQRRLRSYWALDPTYFSNEDGYPEISYDVYKEGVNSDKKTTHDYPLLYRSYNDILGTFTSDAFEKKPFEYCTENTMNVSTLKSGRAKASMTSAVLLGHYVITDKTGKEVFNGATEEGKQADTFKVFYIRHESDKEKTILLSDEEAIKFFLERTGNVLYVKVPKINGVDGTESETEFEYQPLKAAHLGDSEGNKKYADIEDFMLEHPVKIDNDVDVTGASVVSEQWRSLTFANDANLGNYYIYDITEDGNYGYIPLSNTKVDMKAVHKSMYSAYGLIEKFQAGKAYFNVPLKHIWSNLNSTSNTFDSDNVILGDYGVVRNHVYDLKIKSISGLGTGIGDINQPIVPPTEVDKYYISAKLNILKWRLVSQSVDL